MTTIKPLLRRTLRGSERYSTNKFAKIPAIIFNTKTLTKGREEEKGQRVEKEFIKDFELF